MNGDTASRGDEGGSPALQAGHAVRSWLETESLILWCLSTTLYARMPNGEGVNTEVDKQLQGSNSNLGAGGRPARHPPTRLTREPTPGNGREVCTANTLGEPKSTASSRATRPKKETARGVALRRLTCRKAAGVTTLSQVRRKNGFERGMKDTTGVDRGESSQIRKPSVLTSSHEETVSVLRCS